MKNYSKKIVAAVLTTAMAMSVGMPAFANVSDTADTIGTAAITRAHDVEMKKEVTATTTEWKYNIIVPGQDPEGEIYPPGSSITYVKTGGSPVYLTFTIGGSVGSVSLNVDPGALATKGTAGARNIGVNTRKPCLLVVDQKVKVIQYSLYERLAGSSLDWKFVGYQYGTQILSSEYRVVEVRSL